MRSMISLPIHVFPAFSIYEAGDRDWRDCGGCGVVVNLLSGWANFTTNTLQIYPWISWILIRLFLVSQSFNVVRYYATMRNIVDEL